MGGGPSTEGGPGSDEPPPPRLTHVQLADATTVALDRLEKGEGAEGAGQKPKKPAKRSRGASRGLDAVDQAMRAEGLL